MPWLRQYDGCTPGSHGSGHPYQAGCSTPPLALSLAPRRRGKRFPTLAAMSSHRLPALLAVLSAVTGLAVAQTDNITAYANMESHRNASTRSVQFLFFNPSNLNEAPLSVKSPSELSANFDPALETVVIIHGFADYFPGSYLIPALIKGYGSLGKRNLMAVEWGELAAAPWYVTAARNTYRVGGRLAEFLQAMSAERGLDVRRLEMVGFSLGAHIAGVAASQLTQRPRKIIGLDPAELLFAESPLDFILDKTDAPLVEIIHTSGGYIGFKRPLGHRDFFPNGGEHPQPGCEGDLAGTCSHRRAYQYFAEALQRRGKGYRGTLCSSMAEYTAGLCLGAPRLSIVNREFNPQLKGRFYLLTNSAKPFARKQP